MSTKTVVVNATINGITYGTKANFHCLSDDIRTDKQLAQQACVYLAEKILKELEEGLDESLNPRKKDGEEK